jgi:predicted metalloprotease
MSPYQQQAQQWPAAQAGGWGAPGQPVWDGKQWVQPAATGASQWGGVPSFNPNYGNFTPAPSAQHASFTPVPQRKKTSVGALLGLVGVVFATLFLLFFLVGTLFSDDSTIPTAPSTDTSTGTTTTEPTSTSQPTQPTQTTGSSDDEYRNDDYTVGAPGLHAGAGRPEPSTWDEATQMLTDNALYNATVPAPVRCELSPVDLYSATPAKLKSYFDELTACLMRVWDPTLQEAGFYAVRPVINIYSSEIDSPCGALPMENAVFCSANEQVYYATDLPRIIPADARRVRMVIEEVIAHEFGHAVQNRTGILPSGNAWQNNYTSKDDESSANQVSRQLELQADCFAGEFLSAVQQSLQLTQEEADAVALTFYSIGDDVLTGDPDYEGNHGHGQNRVNWLAQGFAQNTLSSCNTFRAAAADIE